MNASGKSALAVLALACILGLGWWGLHLAPKPEDLPRVAPTDQASLSTIDQAWFSEIDSLVRLASDLLVAGNVAGAATLIEIVESRVAHYQPQSRVESLRKALAADRERLSSARSLDLVNAATRIDRIILDVDALPSIATTQPLGATSAAAPPAPSDPSATLWQRMLAGIETRILQVVRVTRLDHADSALLSPSEATLAAERLRVRLLSARMALLARQDIIFTQDVAVARKIFERAFDKTDPRVQEHLAAMDALAALGGRLRVSAALQAAPVMAEMRQRLSPESRP